MTVTVYSRVEIENRIRNGNFPENTAVISFYDPAITIILSLIYGFDRRCLAPVSGAFLGIAVTAILGIVFTGLFLIHGTVMESSESLLYAGYQHLDLTSIFMASIFLGSSGAVMD